MRQIKYIQLIGFSVSVISIMLLLFFITKNIFHFSRLILIYRILFIYSIAFISFIIPLITSGALNKQFPISLSVLIIGFPETGKTTFITSLFNQILKKKISQLSVEVEGKETIRRIVENIDYFNNSQKIPATQDNQIFSYKTSLYISSLFRKRKVTLDFGDFPGESSLEFSKKYNNSFLNTPFARYIMQSDSRIFFIDCGKYLSEKLHNSDTKYINEIIKAYTEIWLNLKSLNKYLDINLKKSPTILIFAKSDIFVHYVVCSYLIDQLYSNDVIIRKEKSSKIQDYINYISFNKIPNPFYKKHLKTEEIPLDFIDFFDIQENEIIYYKKRFSTNQNLDLFPEINKLKEQIIEDFIDIIKFFNEENNYFHYLFISSYGEIRDSKNYSIQFEQLINYLIP